MSNSEYKQLLNKAFGLGVQSTLESNIFVMKLCEVCRAHVRIQMCDNTTKNMEYSLED